MKSVPKLERVSETRGNKHRGKFPQVYPKSWQKSPATEHSSDGFLEGGFFSSFFMGESGVVGEEGREKFWEFSGGIPIVVSSGSDMKGEEKGLYFFCLIITVGPSVLQTFYFPLRSGLVSCITPTTLLKVICTTVYTSFHLWLYFSFPIYTHVHLNNMIYALYQLIYTYIFMRWPIIWNNINRTLIYFTSWIKWRENHYGGEGR